MRNCACLRVLWAETTDGGFCRKTLNISAPPVAAVAPVNICPAVKLLHSECFKATFQSLTPSPEPSGLHPRADVKFKLCTEVVQHALTIRFIDSGISRYRSNKSVTSFGTQTTLQTHFDQTLAGQTILRRVSGSESCSVVFPPGGADIEDESKRWTKENTPAQREWNCSQTTPVHLMR